MHFLRKQSHAESSNRLVDFSREVLRVLDHAGPRGPAALSFRQHLERGAPGTAVGARTRTRCLWNWRLLLGPPADRVPPSGGSAAPCRPRHQAALGGRGEGLLDRLVKLTPEALARAARLTARGRRGPETWPDAAWPS